MSEFLAFIGYASALVFLVVIIVIGEQLRHKQLKAPVQTVSVRPQLFVIKGGKFEPPLPPSPRFA